MLTLRTQIRDRCAVTGERSKDVWPGHRAGRDDLDRPASSRAAPRREHVDRLDTGRDCQRRFELVRGASVLSGAAHWRASGARDEHPEQIAASPLPRTIAEPHTPHVQPYTRALILRGLRVRLGLDACILHQVDEIRTEVARVVAELGPPARGRLTHVVDVCFE